MPVTLEVLAGVPRSRWIACFIVFGLLTGSLVNVLVWRLPRSLALRARSRCRHCETRIAWHDQLPLVSFAWLRRRCRHCGGPIAWRYPLGELGTAALWRFKAWWFGPGLPTLAAGSFLTGLPALPLIDLEHMLLPDLLTLSLAANGLLNTLVGPWPFVPRCLGGECGGDPATLASPTAAAPPTPQRQPPSAPSCHGLWPGAG